MAVWKPYSPRGSADERLLEYNVLKTLFDETTPYQRVQIIQTKEFGNALVLDGYISE